MQKWSKRQVKLSIHLVLVAKATKLIKFNSSYIQYHYSLILKASNTKHGFLQHKKRTELQNQNQKKIKKLTNLVKSANTWTLASNWDQRVFYVPRNIRHYKPTTQQKISSMFLINLHHFRPSNSFTIQQPCIIVHIKSSPKCLHSVHSCVHCCRINTYTLPHLS